jgi:hypothetical protein
VEGAEGEAGGVAPEAVQLPPLAPVRGHVPQPSGVVGFEKEEVSRLFGCEVEMNDSVSRLVSLSHRAVPSTEHEASV